MPDYSYYGGYYGYSGTSTRSRMGLAVPAFLLSGFLLVYLLAMLGYVSFSTDLLIGVIISMIIYILTLHDIRIGLGFMILAIGISPEIQVGGLNNLRLEDFIVPAIFFAWITKIIRERHKFQPSNLKMPILLIILVSLISSLIAITWNNLSLTRSLVIFFKICEYYLIYVIVLNNLKTKREIKTFIAIMLVVSVITALYSTLVYLEDPDVINASISKRVMGPGGETANILGGYFILHMLIAAGILFQAKVRTYTKWLVIYFLVMLYPFIYTLSRTSYVALFGGLLFVGLFKNKKILFFGIVLLLIIPLFVKPDVVFRMKTITEVLSDNPPPSWQARVDGWSATIDKLSSSPLIGFGVGNTTLAIDSEYVRQAGDIGLIGLLLFMWMLFRMLLTSYRTIDRASDSVFEGYALGYFGALIALMIHAVGATTFTTIRTMEPFFFATGLLYIIHNRYLALDDKKRLEVAVPEHEEEDFLLDYDDVFVFSEDGVDVFDEDENEDAIE